jgi:predicted pyridoxine 5'-phosphate oxidase superfamily flavin-nucleotide-binding protein
MPGSAGEHRLQEAFGTTVRARAFYDHQVLDHLNERMREFVRRMEMVFVATADAGGEADCSFRAGPPGFVGVLDEGTLALPEYRGNGVMGSLGNIAENGHVGLLFVDFCGDGVGLHVNGRASIVPSEVLAARPDLPASVAAGVRQSGGRAAARWVLVEVQEAYIHCAKHIPRMVAVPQQARAWGTDDAARKRGDYFRAKHEPRLRAGPAGSSTGG